MRLPPAFRPLLLALAPLLLAAPLPAAAQADAAAATAPVAGDSIARHVRVHAHILLLDRTASRRAGVRWVQVGDGRIRIEGGERRRARSGVGAAGEIAGVPVSAFIELARDRRLVRSETRAQVATLEGTEAALASGVASLDAWGTARTEGPELVVLPTILEDGRVRLDVRVRLRDEISHPYGLHASGAPVDVVTTLVVRPGRDATAASAAVVESREDAGLLRWGGESSSRDVLVVLRAEVEEP